MFQADPATDRGDEPAFEGMGELLLDWVSACGLTGDQHVRARPSRAAPETAQPAALPTAGRGDLLRAASETGAALLVSQYRATACASLRQEFSGEPDAGKSACPIRRGESGPASRCSPSLLLYRLRRIQGLGVTTRFADTVRCKNPPPWRQSPASLPPPRNRRAPRLRGRDRSPN